MTATSSPDTVVLIHGLWMNGRSWERWQARYEERGMRVLAPSWPGMDGDVEALRADTSAFDDLGVAAIVDHYAAIIEASTRRRSSWGTPSAGPSPRSCSTAVSARPASPSTRRR